MQDGHPQTLGLVLEVDKPQTDQESTEQGQEDVQELYPGMVDDGCQHRAEGGKEHDGRHDSADLQWAQRPGR